MPKSGRFKNVQAVLLVCSIYGGETDAGVGPTKALSELRKSPKERKK